MKPQQQNLFDKINAFDLDGGPAEFSFTHRLARENGWRTAFAERVVAEYRKFLFLAMEAGHPVTPSREVDEAWHLHMIYTDSYWTRLCGEVLPRPLHHGPTRGGQAEHEKFVDWYAKTLDSYRRFFGEPPADVWPPSGQRFAPPKGRTVDLSTHWVIPKSPWKYAASVLALLVACGAGAGNNRALYALLFVILFGGLFITMIVLLLQQDKKEDRHSDTSGGGSGCSSVSCGSSCGSGCGSGCGGGCGGG